MTDLAEWLLAQYAADERDADYLHDIQTCASVEYNPQACDCSFPADFRADLAAKRRIVELHRHEAKGPGPVLHDGSRDLNEGVFGCVICSCVDDDPGWHFTDGWCQTVRLLALPYAGRDGYDERWRPDE
jgi:hypothetical protein